MAGEATAERASFAPSMSDGRPVVSAAARMSRAGRRASGTRLVDDAALVTAPEQQDLEAVEAEETSPTTRSRETSSPRVIRSGTRVQRLAEQAGRAATDGPLAGASPQGAQGRGVSSPMQQAALRGGKATTSADGGVDVASPDGAASSVRSTAAGPTAATVAFARSARSLADSTSTPARVSSVLHAAARAALEGKPDTVERLLRVADSAARREEAAESLMPRVAPRHGSRTPSMWSALRSPVDSAVAIAAAGIDETEDDGAVETPTRRGRSQSTVPVVRSGQRQASTARRSSVAATVKASRRTVASPVTSGTARSVLRSAPPAVRARVKALLSRRSRPSALGYARLADVDEVLQAVTQAFSEAGATADGSVRVEAVRDASGRRRLSNARKQAMANGAKASLSRPSDWAGARTASAVTDPDPRIRRAVSSMSVFRTALGEFNVPVSMDATPVASGAEGSAGSRQGRHVLRTADGRFVSPTRGTGPAATARTAAESRSETRVARSAYGVDTDTVVSQPDGVGSEELAPGMAGAQTTSGRAPQRARSSQAGVASRRQSGQYRNRPGLQSTLGEVDEHSSARHELPVWARRASGSPLVRSSEQRDVMRALARAHTPEQVVQVIAQHGAELGSVPASLPAPVLQVIEQVREGARQDLEARYMAAQEASRDAESGRTRSAPTPRRTQSAEPELLKAVRGLKKRQASRNQSGVGDDRVMKLARKLQSLIHLAEGTGDRDEARRHVRMAENSAAARAEGQGAAPGSNKESGKNKQVDIESLITEVVQSVNRELALRRERRQEDPDGGSWW